MTLLRATGSACCPRVGAHSFKDPRNRGARLGRHVQGRFDGCRCHALDRSTPVDGRRPPLALGATGTVAACDNRLMRMDYHRDFGAGGSGESKNCGKELQH